MSKYDQASQLRRILQTTASSRNEQSNTSTGSLARVIAITSGADNVGKTSFAINLAFALAAAEQRVLLIDTESEIAKSNFGLRAAPYGIFKLKERGATLADVVLNAPGGIKYIADAADLRRFSSLDALTAEQLILQLSPFDSWANIILLLVGSGLQRYLMNFIAAVDEVILITTPSTAVVADTYTMMKVYQLNQISGNLHLVVNRISKQTEGQQVVEQLHKYICANQITFKVNDLGFIYEDINVKHALTKNTPLQFSYRDTVAANCIGKIATRLLFGECSSRPSGIVRFLNKLYSEPVSRKGRNGN